MKHPEVKVRKSVVIMADFRVEVQALIKERCVCAGRSNRQYRQIFLARLDTPYDVVATCDASRLASADPP